MSGGDKVRNMAEHAKGKMKKKTGEAIGDPALAAEGKAEQISGDMKQAGEKVKDAFKR
ncbi:CsbD family protein [Kitasatospora sp. NPDC052896]|uniref:CsbD family protein n=1 Tax=Kitasatospora sp. NPDC052896 TaxID=3364061 RepID=UPI0037C5DADF